MTAATVACPAKVNIFLRILAREDSGHHQIETLFQAVGLFDRVDVRPGSAGVSLEIDRRESGPGTGDIVGDLGDPSRNTVVRAAHDFFAATGIAPAVSLRLTKAIPAGTGLGGGSSDAAGTLAALNLMHGEPLAPEDLIELGGRIGADVPFFCAGLPSAMAWGRGDRLLRCTPPTAAHAVLVISHDRVSTAVAYRETSALLTLPAPAALLGDLTAGDWNTLGTVQANDFERTVFARFPQLADVRAALEGDGALVARLTGSGSAVFGVFDDGEAARQAARRLRGRPDVVAALVAPTLTTVPGATRA